MRAHSTRPLDEPPLGCQPWRVGRILRALGLTSLALTIGCGPRAAPIRADAFSHFTTRRVDLYTDLRPARARALAEELEAVEDFFAHRFFPCARDFAMTRTSVTAIHDRGDADLILGPIRAGFYARARRSWERDLMVMSVSDDRQVYWLRTFAHELAHRYMAACYPRVPTWINEGMAEVLSTVRFEGKRARVGVPPFAFGRRFDTVRWNRMRITAVPRSRLPRLEALRRLTRREFYRDDHEEAILNYAAAWSAVHLLQVGDADLKRRFGQYLARLGADERPADQLFDEAFQGAALDQRVERYQRENLFDHLVMSRPRVVAPSVVLQPPSSAIHAHLGRLFSLTGNEDVAASHFAAAPQIAPVLLAMAENALSRGDHRMANAHLERILHRTPSDEHALHAWLAGHRVAGLRDEIFERRQHQFAKVATDPNGLALAAQLALEAGNLTRAARFSRRAADGGAACWRCWAVRGHVALAMNKRTQGVSYLRSAAAQLGHAISQSSYDGLREDLDRVQRPPRSTTTADTARVRAELERCYRSLLETGTRVRAEVTVELRLANTGAVRDVARLATTLRSPATEACMTAAVRRLIFPPLHEPTMTLSTTLHPDDRDPSDKP
ncbi:MAG: hypothetical protein AAGA56_03810 [Myxococcota bacterium]